MFAMLSFVLLGIAIIFAWLCLGCIVVALRMRYYPFLLVGLFIFLLGWMVASTLWTPAMPTWLNGAAVIVIVLYRWLDARQQRPEIPTLSLKNIVFWWKSPKLEQPSSDLQKD